MGKESLILKISEAEETIRSILLRRNLHQVDKLNAKYNAKKLISYTNGTDAKAFVLLGKVNYLLNNVDEARTNFESAIELNGSLAAPYYGLFKIYVDQENYSKALYNIKLYSQYSGINVDIYINLLNTCLGNESIYIEQQDNVLGQYKIDERILNCYNKTIICINNCDYRLAIENVQKCMKLIGTYNYHIDLSFLLRLLQNVNRMRIELNNKKKIENLKESFFCNDNWGSCYLYLIKLIELEPNDINIWLLLIEISILYVDYKGAKKYLECAKKVINVPNRRIEYLEEKINKLNKDSREYISDLKIKGRIISCINKGNITDAIDLCNKYCNERNDVDYLFFAGKILYENNDIDKACMFFDRYKQLGCSYLKETYYYLFFIYNTRQQNDQASYYAKLIYDLSMYEGVEISIESFITLLLMYESDFKSEYMLDLEKNLLNPEFLNNNIKVYQKVNRLDA